MEEDRDVDDQRGNKPVPVPVPVPVKEWENLPGPAVLLIIKSFTNPVDFSSFSHTCRSWRQIAAAFFTPRSFLSSLPPLPYWYKEDCFFSIPDQRFFRHTDRDSSPSKGGGKKNMCGFSHGFLVICDDSAHELSLVDPFTREEIRGFPKVTIKGSIYAALTAPPSDPDCVVLLCKYMNYVLHCKKGDEFWSESQLTPTLRFFRVTSDGKARAFCSDGGSLVTIDFMPFAQGQSPLATRWELTGLSSADERGVSFRHMVESGGELFLPVFDDSQGQCKVDVYKLDVARKEWTKIKNLRGRALFVDLYGIYLIDNPQKWGFRGDVVYTSIYSTRHRFCIFPVDGNAEVEYVVHPISPSIVIFSWILPSLC